MWYSACTHGTTPTTCTRIVRVEHSDKLELAVAYAVGSEETPLLFLASAPLTGQIRRFEACIYAFIKIKSVLAEVQRAEKCSDKEVV